MISCKKSTNTTTKCKNIAVANGTLVDVETGEDIIPILSRIYGNNYVDITITVKDDEEIETEIGGEE